MQPVLRSLARVSRARSCQSLAYAPRRFAHGSYGNDQSGHQKAENENPKRDMEHPGPETPASKGSSPSSSQSSSSSNEKASNLSHTQAQSSEGRPAIHKPDTARGDEDPEVKKHNEEMEQRHEKSANQL